MSKDPIRLNISWKDPREDKGANAQDAFEPFFEEFGKYRQVEGPHPAGTNFGQPGASFFAGSMRAVFEFPNGYGASVITGVMCGGADYELAVLDVKGRNHIAYDTPVTDDVERGDAEDIRKLLRQIQALPAKGA